MQFLYSNTNAANSACRTKTNLLQQFGNWLAKLKKWKPVNW